MFNTIWKFCERKVIALCDYFMNALDTLVHEEDEIKVGLAFLKMIFILTMPLAVLGGIFALLSGCLLAGILIFGLFVLFGCLFSTVYLVSAVKGAIYG